MIQSIFDVEDASPCPSSLYVPGTAICVHLELNKEKKSLNFVVSIGANTYDEYTKPAREFMLGKPFTAQSIKSLGYFLVELWNKTAQEIQERKTKMSYKADEIADYIVEEFMSAVLDTYQKELTSVGEEKSNALLGQMTAKLKHMVFAAALEIEELKP